MDIEGRITSDIKSDLKFIRYEVILINLAKNRPQIWAVMIINFGIPLTDGGYYCADERMLFCK
jgi:hypothetical protein